MTVYAVIRSYNDHCNIWEDAIIHLQSKPAAELIAEGLNEKETDPQTDYSVSGIEIMEEEPSLITTKILTNFLLMQIQKKKQEKEVIATSM